MQAFSTSVPHALKVTRIDRATVATYVEANSITLLASSPFDIVACQAPNWTAHGASVVADEEEGMGEESTGSSDSAGSEYDTEGAEAEVEQKPPPMLVAVLAAQLPKRSQSIQPKLLRATYGPAMTEPYQAFCREHGGGQRRDSEADGACHLATLWGLLCNTAYVLRVSFTAAATTEGKSLTRELDVRTAPTPSPFLSAPGGDGLVLDHFAATRLLYRADFVDWPLAMGQENHLLVFAPAGQIDLAYPWLGALLYHGLFPLPSLLGEQGGVQLYAFLLVNQACRYVIDLNPPSSGAPPPPAPSLPAGKKVEMGGRAERPAQYTWRHSRRVRRAIASGHYAVAIRESPEDILAALHRCRDNHMERDHDEWLRPAMCALIAQSGTRGERTFGVRVLCVDVVRKDTGEVLAGCCGVQCGAVYHDFSMYTVALEAEGFGTLATKLVGEALQRCGYDMWYWGLRVPYMAAYERRYGARHLSRKEFYDRWVARRDAAPDVFLGDFLRGDRGMLPCYSP